MFAGQSKAADKRSSNSGKEEYFVDRGTAGSNKG